MRRNKVLTVVIVILVIGFLGALIEVFERQSPQTQVTGEDAARSSAAVSAGAQAPEPEPEDIPIVSAWELSGVYNENELLGNQTYQGVDMYLVGMVTSIGENAIGQPYVVLEGQGNFFFYPQIFFQKSQISDLATLREGDEVVIRCTGDGTSISKPVLKNGELVEVLHSAT